MAKNLLGQRPSKNSTNKKGFNTHQLDAQNADKQRKLEWMVVQDNDNHSQSPALNVANKTQCHLNQKKEDQYFAEIVLKKTVKAKEVIL